MSIFSDVFGTGKQTNTATTTPQVPPTVAAARDEVIARATEIANEPYAAYNQPRVAGFTPDQLAGFEAARNVADVSGNLSALTPDLTREGIEATKSLAVTLPEADISAYMSPYLEGVLDPVLRDIEEKAARERLRLGQQSARTGAFGGSRQAIAEAELERSLQRNIGEESAKQRQQAYNTALAQFRLDQTNIPALYKNSMNLLSTGLDQNAARIGTEVNPLLTIGGAQQGLDQRNLDVMRETFLEERNYPREALDVLKSSLTLSPSVIGTGETRTSTTPGANTAGTITGTILQAPKLITAAQDIGKLFGFA
jgi:hypothetical protein